MGELEIAVARHDEKIKDLETRAEERRAANGELFSRLDDIKDSINKLETSTAILWYKTGLIGLLGGAIPAVVTLLILIITGKI